MASRDASSTLNAPTNEGVNDVVLILLTLVAFSLLAVLVGVLDRRLDDRSGGDR